MQQRYEELELRDALSRRSDYAQACSELAVILQKIYGTAPKKLQVVIFSDTLHAIRLLPGLEASQYSAVMKLVQSAETILPRQKRTQVLSEFKHAAVMQRRRSKMLEDDEVSVSCEFSADILVHIFGFLDARSLAKAAAVCRSWRTSANDEMIWKDLFESNFWGLCTLKSVKGAREQNLTWKDRFKDAVKRHPLRWFASNRAFCKSCDKFIWLEGTCKSIPACSVSGSHHHTLKPLRPNQVIQILMRDKLASSSSSSSDSDSDDSRRIVGVSKLWAIPKLDMNHS